MDPRLGIDTSGPGEAVFAIRFIGKPQFLWKNRNFRTRKKLEKIPKIPIRTYFLDELEMSSVYILGVALGDVFGMFCGCFGGCLGICVEVCWGYFGRFLQLGF